MYCVVPLPFACYYVAACPEATERQQKRVEQMCYYHLIVLNYVSTHNAGICLFDENINIYVALIPISVALALALALELRLKPGVEIERRL